MKFNIIVTDPTDMSNTIKNLSQVELVSQTALCLTICDLVINNGPVSEENEELIDYITHRFPDFIDYTEKLIEAWVLNINPDAKEIVSFPMKDFDRRIREKTDKIGDYFNIGHIDWQYIKKLCADKE